LLVTLARFNAVQVSGMHQAWCTSKERFRAGVELSGLILPQMTANNGARAGGSALELVGAG